MRFFKLAIRTGMLLLFASTSSWGQYYTPVSFWLSPQLTAPTAMATNEHAQLSAHYQKQGLAGNLGSRSMILSGQFPLLPGSSARLGTAGLTVLRQEGGASYLFATTGAILSYNYTASLSSQHHLVGGVQGGYFSRGIDWSRVRTSNQFTEGQLNPDLGHGETFSDYKSSAITANVGLGYFITDGKGEQVFHIGGGLMNANRARFTYLEDDNRQAEPHRWTAYSQLRLIRTPFYELSTNMYWQRESGIQDVVGGLQLTKGINARKSLDDEYLGLGVYYSPDHAATLALQLLLKDLLLGFSYSMPVGNKNLNGLQNAAEVTVGWRLQGEATRGRSFYGSGYQRSESAYMASRKKADKRARKAYKYRTSKRASKEFKRPATERTVAQGGRKFSKKVSAYKFKANKRKAYKNKGRKSKVTLSKKYKKALRATYKMKKPKQQRAKRGWLKRIFGSRK